MTPATPRQFAGLPRSVTRSSSASAGSRSLRPSRKRASMPSSVPCMTVVATDVRGVTPAGRIFRPSRAFTSVLLPRFASPTTSTRSRPAPRRSRSPASVSRSAPLASASSSSSARTSAPSRSIARIPGPPAQRRQGPLAAQPQFDGEPLRRAHTPAYACRLRRSEDCQKRSW